MRTCVIFAASIFDRSRIPVIEEFFSVFKNSFADSSFYVGINYGSLPDLEYIIGAFGLDCRYARVKRADLYTRSDASAYQAALGALKSSPERYDIYWFAHTKGGVNAGDEIRQRYLHDYFADRSAVENMFTAFPHLGSYGLRGNSISAAGVQWQNYKKDTGIGICENTKFSKFIYDHVNWSYIETMYTIKKEPVECFLDNIGEVFLNSPLDPWYFETTLPWIASRCGFFPYLKDKNCFWGRGNLNDITRGWIFDNRLDHLLPYLEL